LLIGEHLRSEAQDAHVVPGGDLGGPEIQGVEMDLQYLHEGQLT